MFVTKGGKVLANWEYPNQPVSAATINLFQTVENQTLVEDFGDEFFSMAPIASHLQTQLRPVRDALLTSLSMYYGDLKHKYGIDHLIVKMLNDGALTRDIPLSQLATWGKAVHNRFVAENAKNLRSTDNSKIDSLEKSLQLLQRMYAAQLQINKKRKPTLMDW